LQQILHRFTLAAGQIKAFGEFCKAGAAGRIPLQQDGEGGLRGVVPVTVDLKALADIAPLPRLKLLDESPPVLLLMIKEGGAYPIGKKDSGCLIRLASLGKQRICNAGSFDAIRFNSPSSSKKPLLLGAIDTVLSCGFKNG